MINEVLAKLYLRDLDKLKAEISQYADEADLWKTSGEITNSAGNLTLHLIGNLNHYFGAVLGGSGYVRHRDDEFSGKNASREWMLAEIDSVGSVVSDVLSRLTAADLAAIYPEEVFGHPMTTEYFLVHLATHFNYHLGQINYHRRLLAS